jgi:hypothetical protein
MNLIKFTLTDWTAIPTDKKIKVQSRRQYTIYLHTGQWLPLERCVSMHTSWKQWLRGLHRSRLTLLPALNASRQMGHVSLLRYVRSLSINTWAHMLAIFLLHLSLSRILSANLDGFSLRTSTSSLIPSIRYLMYLHLNSYRRNVSCVASASL